MEINKFIERATIIVDNKRAVNSRVKPYQLTDFHQRAFDYFMESLSNGRGLAIIGNVGCGKTLFFKAMNEALPPEDRFYHYCAEGDNSLEEVLKSKGKSEIIKIVSQLRKPDGTLTHSYIEDVYTEKAVKHEIDGFLHSQDYEEAIVHFGMQFYKKYEKNLGHRLYFDTNATKEQIVKRYGERWFSRVAEMTDVLIVKDSEYINHRKI